MKQLLWAEQAEADVAAIIEQASATDPDEGMRLLDLILNAPKRLLEYPALGRNAGAPGRRKWLIKETPFLLLYRVNAETVQIIRVLHRASDWTNLA